MTRLDVRISMMQKNMFEDKPAQNAALLVKAVRQILKEEREAAADVTQSVVVEEEHVEGVLGSETSTIRHGGTSNRGGDDGYERDNNSGGSNVNGTATINTA